MAISSETLTTVQPVGSEASAGNDSTDGPLSGTQARDAVKDALAIVPMIVARIELWKTRGPDPVVASRLEPPTGGNDDCRPPPLVVRGSRFKGVREGHRDRLRGRVARHDRRVSRGPATW